MGKGREMGRLPGGRCLGIDSGELEQQLLVRRQALDGPGVLGGAAGQPELRRELLVGADATEALLERVAIWADVGWWIYPHAASTAANVDDGQAAPPSLAVHEW